MGVLHGIHPFSVTVQLHRFINRCSTLDVVWGGFAMALAQRVQAYVIGVDVAAHLLSYGNSRARHLPVQLILGSAETLPVADQSVDCAIMSLILHQIADQERAVREAYRVVRPRGRLVVRTVLPEVALSEWVRSPAIHDRVM